jgi:hypothetical protein
MGDLIIKPESGGSIKLQNNAGTNALVSDNSGNITLAGATTLTGNVTLSGTANNLGTVTSGNLSNSAIVMPRLKENTFMYDSANTATSTELLDTLNISHSEYLTVTPEHTGDILSFSFAFNTSCGGYFGYGIQRDTAIGFTTAQATIWSTGRHGWGNLTSAGLDYETQGGTITDTASAFGMAADTTYYCRMIGMTHSPDASYIWGNASTNSTKTGIHLNCQRWSVV